MLTKTSSRHTVGNVYSTNGFPKICVLVALTSDGPDFWFTDEDYIAIHSLTFLEQCLTPITDPAIIARTRAAYALWKLEGGA